jgi:arylsulfatase A-like enzyme
MKKLFAFIIVSLATAAVAAKPNIILVFIDDMGYSDFSCFGNDMAKIPQVDSLAAEGIAFEQFYVNSPICSPSRVAISTGQYPQRWKITSFLCYRKNNEKRGMVQYLDTKAPMLARSLKEVGYATGHFGKWHMGGQRDDDTCPHITEYGFDESLTNFEGLGKRLLNHCFSPGKEKPFICDHNSRNLGKPEEITWMDRSKVTGGFADAALTFIKKAEAEGQPFYVNVWPDDVHGPLYPPLDKWKDEPRAKYMAVLENMDAQLRPLFSYVKETPALRDNTMILVCSDNGPARGQGRSIGMRGQKAVLYEAGVRSPLVVWAPGLMKKKALGTRNTESVFSAIDIVPSLLEIAGAEPPTNAGFDGEDLSKTLLGRKQQSRGAPIFFRRPPDHKQFKGDKNLPDLAMRYRQWKFYCDYDGSRSELYSLSEDLGETTNLTDKQPALMKKLTAELVAWHESLPPDKGSDFK